MLALIDKITKLCRAEWFFKPSHHRFLPDANGATGRMFTTFEPSCNIKPGYLNCIIPRSPHHGHWTHTPALSGLQHLLLMQCKQLPNHCSFGKGNLTFPRPPGNWLIRRSSSTSSFEHLNEQSSLLCCKLAFVDGVWLPTRIPFYPTQRSVYINQ